MSHEDICEAITGYPLSKVVVFDTETTGTDDSSDELLQISICDGYGNLLLNTYLKPRWHWRWPEAEAINHITPWMVRHAPRVSDVSEIVRGMLLADKLVVCYNASFDINFLISEGVLRSWPDHCFDVMEEYAKVHGTKRNAYGGGYRWSKLSACAKHYGYSFAPHDASDDAKATAFCLRALMQDKKYIKTAMQPMLADLKHIHLAQTKATMESVSALLSSGPSSDIAGKLKLGEVSRGKTKGTPRYECYIGDVLVGYSTSHQTDKIRKLYMLDDSDPLPKSIGCKVQLSISSGAPHASTDISARAPLQREVSELSAVSLSAPSSYAIPRPLSMDDMPHPERRKNVLVRLVGRCFKPRSS